MKKYIIAGLSLIAGVAVVCHGAGGADYGRGAETDPVASAMVGVVSGRVSAVEAGVSTVAGSTNVWNTAASNASNWVSHASAMLEAVTNVLVTADTKTNTIIVVRGSIKSWTITE